MAMVSYTWETIPKISKEEWDRVRAIKDEDIDYSDIPRMTDLSSLVPRVPRAMYKPVKVNVNCKLDADIVAWLKSGGKGYQTRLNAILRCVMLTAASRRTGTSPA
ncbi:MAG: BrnA antitoxin family protein [Spirochaetaceae bacterium]|jgi:uncharacterized protein (DUF4415 family)|nr:BrnA antitoxin family protein [Spirochaetaceae bacterium]